MAYFSNSSDGMRFSSECAQCKLGYLMCPIAEVQVIENYHAVNNGVASRILGSLVSSDGSCTMLRRFPDMFLKGGKE